ncbi:MarR family winged helix-turn-helix transcriptional regulator [Kribbella speibonae]|uniref:MarR family transcriptional regulator n=1 Tax=Kribbella speibonae TaxID=1572660 RepID=A0A4R0IQF5_9ACTN|nr:MarR family transcriptional regulator [Kribbella speibonae]TCC27154.1 MarR family transcriptional regulator [Kribbella speibonae]TCC35993.1 MarR family transcriptional regulator [Kribbella speibonae]
MSTTHNAGEWSPDAPADEADVLIALRFAERTTRKAIAEELAGTVLHTGQELVLAKLLHHGSLPVARLAKVLDVEVPTATKTTQRMEAAGLVRRVKSTTDARQVGIELTDRGVELAHTVQEIYDRAGRRALAQLTAEDRRLLRNLLWTVTMTLEPMSHE